MLCRIPRLVLLLQSVAFWDSHTHLHLQAPLLLCSKHCSQLSPQRIQMSSFRTLHLSLGFSAPRCMHWMFLLLHRNPDAHGRNCVLWWGRWLGGKGISLPKSKFQFHSPDSIRSPWIGLCQEHFSHTASSASIIHVLFDCTWYVQVFAGFWELRERRNLYFSYNIYGVGGKGREDIQLIFLAKEGAIWMSKGVKPLLLVKKWGVNPHHPEAWWSFQWVQWSGYHPVSAAASSVRSGEGCMCLSPTSVVLQHLRLALQSCFSESEHHCSCDGLGTHEAQLVRRDNNF